MSKTYVKYLLTKHKKLLFVEIVILIAIIAYLNFVGGGLFGYLTNGAGANFDSVPNYQLHSVLKYFLVLNGIIMPLYLNVKYYKQNGNDLFLSLPIKKEKRFLSEMMFGWIVVVVPAFISVLFSVISGYMYDTSLFSMALQYMIVFTLFYVINCYVAVKTNNLFDSIVLVLSLAFIMTQLPGTIETLIRSNTITDAFYSIYDFSGGGTIHFINIIMCCLSPIFMLTQLFQFADTFYLNGAINVMIIIFYLVAITLMVWLTLRAYKNKRVEQYGGKTKSRICYPFMITMLCAMLLSLFLSPDMHTMGIVIAIVVIFIIFLAAFFLADRRVHFKVSYFIGFASLLVGVLLFRAVVISSDGFGTIQKNYQKNDIDIIEVSYYSANPESYSNYQINFGEDGYNAAKSELDCFLNQNIQKYKDDNRWWPQYRNPNKANIYVTILYRNHNEYLVASSGYYRFSISKDQLNKIKRLVEKYDFQVMEYE